MSTLFPTASRRRVGTASKLPTLRSQPWVLSIEVPIDHCRCNHFIYSWVFRACCTPTVFLRFLKGERIVLGVCFGHGSSNSVRPPSILQVIPMRLRPRARAGAAHQAELQGLIEPAPERDRF